MKKQCIDAAAIIGAVFLIGTLLGCIIAYQMQDIELSIEPKTQIESIMYLEQPLAIKHFTEKGAVTSGGGEFLSIVLNEETTLSQKDNMDKPVFKPTTEESTNNEDVAQPSSIIKADHYACPIDEIYFTYPVREYTAEQRELLTKMLYCEAGGESWDCQVATCSAIINHIEYNRGDFGVLDKSNHFDPASYYRYKTPNQMQYDVVDYVLSGHLIANVKYFRMSYYHNFGTPMFAIDGEYFSR